MGRRSRRAESFCATPAYERSPIRRRNGQIPFRPPPRRPARRTFHAARRSYASQVHRFWVNRNADNYRPRPSLSLLSFVSSPLFSSDSITFRRAAPRRCLEPRPNEHVSPGDRSRSGSTRHRRRVRATRATVENKSEDRQSLIRFFTWADTDNQLAALKITRGINCHARVLLRAVLESPRKLVGSFKIFMGMRSGIIVSAP